MWYRSNSCPTRRHPRLKMADIKLVTWAGVRTYFPVLEPGAMPLVELSTLGIARNATFAVKRIVAWRSCVSDNRTSFVENVTDDPAEFTPLVLHFANEPGPPTMGDSFFSVFSMSERWCILTCAYKR